MNLYYDDNGIKVRIQDKDSLLGTSVTRDLVLLSVDDESGDPREGGSIHLTPEDAIILGQRILGAGLDARERQRRTARDEAVRRGLRADLAMPPYVAPEDSAVGLRGSMQAADAG